jgi:hypothetical protein
MRLDGDGEIDDARHIHPFHKQALHARPGRHDRRIAFASNSGSCGTSARIASVASGGRPGNET